MSQRRQADGISMRRLVSIISIALLLIVSVVHAAADDEESVLGKARVVVDAYKAEIGKPVNEQSSKVFEELKKRLAPLWNALARLALKDKEAEALKERLYEVSAGAEQRIVELRKLEAERERAELTRLAAERREERRRQGKSPSWNEPIGFRDIPFGTSAVAVAALLPELSCGQSCSGRISIGVAAVFIILQFRGGGLDAVRLLFDSPSFAPMKGTFLERYGPPTSQKSSPVQNRLGAQFEGSSGNRVGKFMRGPGAAPGRGRARRDGSRSPA